MNIDGRTITHEVLEANRFAAIKLNKAGVEPNVIAASFGVTRQAVYRWLRNCEKNGEDALKSRKALGRETNLTQKQIEQLLVLLHKPASELGYATDLWSGTKVRHLIKHHFGIDYHPKHMPRLLRRLGLWLVFPERRALEQDAQKVQEWKLDKLPKIIEDAAKRRALLFYADESLISLIPYVGKTWAFPGDKPIAYVSGMRGQHIGVTAAVNQQGKMCFELTKEDETFTAKTFLRFINKLRGEHPRKCLSLIVDGAPTHKAKIVKDFVAANASWLRLEILPAYSPELNPTEKSWGFVKTKKLNAMKARDKKELRKAVIVAMRKTKNDTTRVASFFDGQ